MRLEEQDLTPYAEPVSMANLKVGEIYFLLRYVDDEMLIPVLEPWVYLGRDLDVGDLQQVYFQDIDSHRKGVRYTSDDDNEAEFYSGSEREINHIFEYESALDELARCALRRRSNS